MKRLLCLFLTGAMFFGCAGCGNKDEKPAPETKTVSTNESVPQIPTVADKNLGGVWNCIDGAVEGEYLPGYDVIGMDAKLSEFDIAFAYDSKSYGNFFKGIYSHEDGGSVVAPVADFTAADGVVIFNGLTLPDVDMKVEYEITTVDESKRYDMEEDFKKYFEKSTNNHLKIHLTGKYTADSVEKTIDATFSYEKDVYQNSIKARNILGNWLDNKGNKWSFTYDDAHSQTLFEMTTQKGEKFTGDIRFSMWSNAEAGLKEGVNIRYDKDESKNFQAYITAFDVYEITAQKVDTGDKFTLTRTK